MSWRFGTGEARVERSLRYQQPPAGPRAPRPIPPDGGRRSRWSHEADHLPPALKSSSTPITRQSVPSCVHAVEAGALLAAHGLVDLELPRPWHAPTCESDRDKRRAPPPRADDEALARARVLSPVRHPRRGTGDGEVQPIYAADRAKKVSRVARRCGVAQAPTQDSTGVGGRGLNRPERDQHGAGLPSACE